MSGTPALFLDRDGVVNECPGDGYVLTPAGFRFMPGIFPLMRWAADRGWKRVLVTSQQGVGKGLMSQADLDAIHDGMQATLAREAAPFDAIQACTHLAGTCTCRKPSPEMIHAAAERLAIDLAQSVLIGDHDRDIEMARRAGVGTAIRLAGGRPETVPPDVRVTSLGEALAWLQRAQ